MNTATDLLAAPSSHTGLVGDAFFDSSLDGCSICLEPFTSLDPPSATKCKHEYHLHCILEWSQRRVECPVCLQHLVLNDPVSQELLASVEREKNLRSLRTIIPVNQTNENSPHVNEPDNDQPIMRHFATIASRARNITRRRQMDPAVSPSEILPSSPASNSPNATQVNNSPLEGAINSSGSLLDNSGKSSPSDLSAFSESLKSKISTASIRYKESISRSTHSLKGKLIAHNDSVKELSREVQREMSAGIAGIARLISQKRSASSVTGETSKETSPDSKPFFTDSNSGGLGVSLAKEKH